MEINKNVVVIDNPLIEHKLSIIRNKNTGTKEFREIIGEIACILCYHALSDAKLKEMGKRLSELNEEELRILLNDLYEEETKWMRG